MDIDNKDIFYEDILQKLTRKEIKVGVIGMGYVGLPLSLSFCEKGIKVIGFDINKTIINSLREGRSHISNICSEKLVKFISQDILFPTNNFEEVKKVDIVILCVPTPLDKNRDPDLSFIIDSVNSIKKYLKKGQIISLESTTYPGTTDDIIKPLIEKEGFKIGVNFFLVYSPERIDPGNKIHNSQNTPKILGGCTKKCTHIGKIIYSLIANEIVVLSSTKAAEMTKLLENIHRAVNIGLVNELKPIAEALNIDLYEVIRAAATKPFGYTAYYPGPGLGGHCIPIDPFYLTWKAKEFGIHTRFIELAGEINSSMPKYVVDKIANTLNTFCKPVKKSKILILGIAYKKNVDDIRESPSLEIIKILLKMGAFIMYNDPYFSDLPKSKNFFEIEYVTLTKESLNSFDCVVLVTDHDIFDYKLIEENSKLIIDTRGKFIPSETIIRS